MAVFGFQTPGDFSHASCFWDVIVGHRYSVDCFAGLVSRGSRTWLLNYDFSLVAMFGLSKGGEENIR